MHIYIYIIFPPVVSLYSFSWAVLLPCRRRLSSYLSPQPLLLSALRNGDPSSLCLILEGSRLPQRWSWASSSTKIHLATSPGWVLAPGRGAGSWELGWEKLHPEFIKDARAAAGVGPRGERESPGWTLPGHTLMAPRAGYTIPVLIWVEAYTCG